MKDERFVFHWSSRSDDYFLGVVYTYLDKSISACLQSIFHTFQKVKVREPKIGK